MVSFINPFSTKWSRTNWMSCLTPWQWRGRSRRRMASTAPAATTAIPDRSMRHSSQSCSSTNNGKQEVKVKRILYFCCCYLYYYCPIGGIIMLINSLWNWWALVFIRVIERLKKLYTYYTYIPGIRMINSIIIIIGRGWIVTV